MLAILATTRIASYFFLHLLSSSTATVNIVTRKIYVMKYLSTDANKQKEQTSQYGCARAEAAHVFLRLFICIDLSEVICVKITSRVHRIAFLGWRLEAMYQQLILLDAKSFITTGHNFELIKLYLTCHTIHCCQISHPIIFRYRNLRSHESGATYSYEIQC